MAQNENESLAALEHLMEEFFDHSTSNARKQDIEAQLTSFNSQRESWKLCVHFVKHTSSQYVSMYALTTIESVINRQWGNLTWEDRSQLKRALYGYLVEQHNGAPKFIRNKLAKLLVDVARFEWPHYYPEFFTNIIQLLQSDQGQLLGLILLRTTSEELMSPRPDLSSDRKEELTRLLQQHIPQVFQILSSILEGLGNKRRHNTTATPPPSPTHPSCAPNLAEQISAASFRPDSKAVTREVLATLQHLFTWTNLAQIPVHIITTVFNFTNISSYAQDDDDMCVLAMSTLNELLYRKCVPPGSQNLFIQLYHHTVQLLRDITNPSSGKIDTIGSDFTEKMSELLALLIEQHLWRLETEPGFSAIEFLGLLFQLTMQLPSVQCYLRCLAVWAAFIEQIKHQNAQKYSEALLGLVVAVLNKMQFTCNADQLQEISTEDANDDNETEWQSFQKTSIEIIAMIAKFAPMETFLRVLVPWKTTHDVFVRLESTVDVRNATLKLEYSETQRLHCILRDFSSLTQTLARLSSFFTDQDSEYFKEATPIIDGLLSKLMQSASLATNARFYHLKVNHPKLVQDFIEAHSQLLSALKTWLLWFNLSNEFRAKELNEVVETALPLLRTPFLEPPAVTHAAAHVLLSLTNTISPPNLIRLPAIVDFIQTAPGIRFGDVRTKEVALCAVSGILVKPWGELSLADSQRRQQMVTALFDGITKDFREIGPNVDGGKVHEIIGGTLPCLSSILEHSKSLPNNSKKLLYQSLKGSIDHAFYLLSVCTKYPEVNEKLLVFFLNVLGVLLQQMGAAGVKHAVRVFLEVAVREQHNKEFSGLDKLLQILQLVMEAPGNCKSFLPEILELCLKEIYPTVIAQANDHPDVIIALLNLFHTILLHKWNYFYRSQIRLGNSPGCSDVDPTPDSAQQPEQLRSILQMFGQALLQPDINTFRTSLGALENLNVKWKLYHKSLFKQHLMSPFLSVLLQTLLDKSHNLLTDDIVLSLYNMAAVDFQYFFAKFLQDFLQNMDGLTSEQKTGLKNNFTQEIDTPTFVHQLQRFVNDMRCFRLCNASLPAGSVVL